MLCVIYNILKLCQHCHNTVLILLIKFETNLSIDIEITRHLLKIYLVKTEFYNMNSHPKHIISVKGGSTEYRNP